MGGGGQGACTEFGGGVGALWRATSLPPARPPDLSVTVWVRKKRWKDRLERRSRLASSVAGKSEAQGGSLAC